MGEPAQALAPQQPDPMTLTWRDYLKPEEVSSLVALDQQVKNLRSERRNLVAQRSAAKVKLDAKAVSAATFAIETLDARKRQLMAERGLIQNRGSARRLLAVRNAMREA